MPEYLAPGVYVEEIETGPVPIEGVSTSTAGFVGVTAQGRVDGLPILVTSFAEFVRTFGGYLPASFGNNRFLPYAVQGFFENGGKRVYIKRVLAASGTAASKSSNLKGGVITRLSKNLGSSDTQAQLSTLRGIHVGTKLTFTQVKNGVTTTKTVTVTTYDDRTRIVTWAAPAAAGAGAGAAGAGAAGAGAAGAGAGAAGAAGAGAGAAGAGAAGAGAGAAGAGAAGAAGAAGFEVGYTTVATDINDPGTPLVITAINPGVWGNNLVVRVFQTSKAQVQVESVAKGTTGNFDTVVLNSASNFYPGAIVEFNKGDSKVYHKVTKILGQSIVLKTPLADAQALDVDAGVDKAKFPKTIASTCEFRLNVTFTSGNNTSVVEDYPILTMDPKTRYYFGTLINNQSNLITVSGDDDQSEDPFKMPSSDDGLNVTMAGGADGTVGGDGTISFSPNDFIGVDNGPGQRTGIQALEDIEQISIIAVPGIIDQTVVNALIDQCVRLRYRFAIIDPDYKGATTAMDDIQKQRQLYDTHYAALYYPRLVISDPDPLSPPQSTIVIPPSGHMAGIYARTDIERGVYKAPANEVILGITDLNLMVNKGEQDILNPPPNQINVLRDFRIDGRGLRVWGARCITSDAQWKYVNVRRLFIFVEASLDRGTQWVVFEPNSYPLWARVTQSITNFLTSVWRDGALMGTKPEEAFFVKCDRTTMTQDDIDNGRLIVLVGIAAVKPAEFVIIRISQFTASASGQ